MTMELLLTFCQYASTSGLTSKKSNSKIDWVLVKVTSVPKVPDILHYTAPILIDHG